MAKPIETKGTVKPLQNHHYATNKSEKYTPQMENITKDTNRFRW